ncbi:DUF5317 family protein [Alicyclobacillus sp. TC]|uniref:DUF5317 family protein n=1 Tax=Alicyclobacillus sp. TC TaxID=2606450 RepID=UPI00351C4E5D
MAHPDLSDSQPKNPRFFLIAVGASLHFLEIIINHGAMLILSSAFHYPLDNYKNIGNHHNILAHPHLEILADRFYIAPFFMSIGDLIVGGGLILFIYGNARKVH